LGPGRRAAHRRCDRLISHPLPTHRLHDRRPRVVLVTFRPAGPLQERC
jgi:hypothetical protein